MAPSIIQVLDSFPWSLCVMIMVISAMLIFRSPLATVLARSAEVSAGRIFKWKAEASVLDVRPILEELRRSPLKQNTVDAERLVIRDEDGRPRMVAAVVEGQPFVALLDEKGNSSVMLLGSSTTGPNAGLAMLTFPSKGRAPGELCALIGGDSKDGTGTVAARHDSGVLREIP